MMELWLNDERADLFGDEIVAIDYAVNKIGDVQSRSGDNSYQFSLPMTNPNKLIMENAQVVISNTLVPYRRMTARLYVNGMIILFGYGVLVEASDTYKIELYGGNADWFKTIGDKSIQDLNLDHLDHYFEPVTIRDYRANNTDWTDAVNYPNVDYGQWGGGTVYWYQFYTGVYYKYLVYKIMLEAGFNLEGAFWDNDTLFSTQFIPFCALFKRDRDYSKRNDGHWRNPTTANPTSTSPLPEVVFNTTVSSTAYNILNPYNADGRFVILDDCDLTFRAKFVVTNNDVVDGIFSAVLEYQDAQGGFQTEVLWNGSLIANNVPAGTTVVFEDTFTVTMGRSELIIRCALITVPVPLQTTGLVCVMNNVGSDFTEIEILDYVVNEDEEDYLFIDEIFNYVTVASTLPDVKQKDVLVTMFNQYCLLCSTNFQTNRVKLFTFKEVNQNIPIAKDWSNKLDLSRKPVITYVSENYAQSNRFVYAKDDIDIYLVADPEYCEGELTIDDQNIESEKIVFESVFAPIKRQSDSFSGTVRLAWIPKFINSQENQVTPRVGVILFENIHLLTMDGFSVETTQPAIHGSPISFANALLPVYYPEFSNLLNYAKFVKPLLKINPVDIHTLDFSIPVYIEYFQAYFYINLIPQFKANIVESTLGDLVKLG